MRSLVVLSWEFMSIFSSKPVADLITDVKKFSDTTYKGETRTGYSAKGGGLGGEVGVDLGKIFLFFKAGLEFKGQVTRASQTMIVVHRGPRAPLNQGANLSAASSLIVNNIVGVTWAGKLEAAFALGVGLDVGIGSGGIVDSDGKSTDFTSSKNGFSDENVGKTFSHKGSIDTKTRSVEVFSAKAGVKAGLSLGGTAGWSHYWGKCVAPLYYEDYKDMSGELAAILLAPKAKAQQRKKQIKLDAVAFLNKHAAPLGQKTVSHSRRLGMGHIPSAQLVAKLTDAEATFQRYFEERFGRDAAKWPKLHQNTIAECNNLAWLLGPASNPLAFMRISTNEQTASFNIGAGASAGASAVGLVAASASAGLDLVDASWKRRAATVRFQSHTEDRKTIWTHDTVLTYNTLGVKVAQVKAAVSGRLVGVGAAEKKKAKAAWTPVDYSWISYKSTVVYWQRPDDDKFKKVPRRILKDYTEAKAVAGTGTGVCIGRSFSLENLRAAYKVDQGELAGFKSKVKMKESNLARARRSPKVVKVLGKEPRPVQGRVTQTEERAFFVDPTSAEFETIRDGLDVDAEALLAFLNDEVVRQMIFTMFKRDAFVKSGNKGPIVGSAFVEVAYKKPDGFKDLRIRNCGDVELDYESSSELVRAFDALSPAKKAEHVSAIRLRVRQLDQENDNRALFSLGFKVAGTGAKINILKVEEAGVGGFVELRSVFFDGSKSKVELPNHGAEYLKRHEQSVPPAALYCQ